MTTNKEWFEQNYLDGQKKEEIIKEAEGRMFKDTLENSVLYTKSYKQGYNQAIEDIIKQIKEI